MEKKENRNIALAVTGVGISRLGSALYSFAIGLYVLKITGSGQFFALTLALGTLPRVILGPFIGNLVDRSNKKVLIVGADLFSALIMAFVTAAAFAGRLSLGLIYTTSVCLAIAGALLDTAYTAAQRDMVRLESLTRLSSSRESVMSLIMLVSPLLAGLIYSLVPLWIFLGINGLSFFLSAISELMIDFKLNRDEREPVPSESFLEGMRGGLAYFKKDLLLVVLSLSVMGLNFFFSSLMVILPHGLVNVIGISERLYGIIMSVLSAGAFLGAVIAGKAEFAMTRRHLLVTLGLMGVLFLLTGGAFLLGQGMKPSTAALIIAPLPVLMVAVSMTLNIPLNVFFQSYVDKDYLGRVDSIAGAVSEAVMPLAYLLFGFLTGYLSPASLLGGCGLIILVIILIMGGMGVLKQMDALSCGTKEREKELS